MENVQKMECEPAALPPVENPQQLSEEEISGGNVWNAVTMSRIQSVIMESLKYAFHAYSASVSTHLFLPVSYTHLVKGVGEYGGF